MKFSDSLIDTKKRIAHVLKMHGWTVLPDAGQPYCGAVGQKSFMSSAGDATVTLCFTPGSESLGVLTSHFKTDGRNAPSAAWSCVSSEISDSSLGELIADFIADVRQAAQKTSSRISAA